MIIPTTSLESSAAASRDLKYRLAALWCIVTVAMLASCGSAEPSGADGDTLSSGVNVDTTVKLTQSKVLEIQRTSSEFQVGLLQDGVLTFSEYESAILAAVRCEEAAGFKILAFPIPGKPGRPGPELSTRGEYQYVQASDDGADRAELGAALQRCEEEYVSIVKPLWAEHVAPTASELQGARNEIGSCLRDQGVAVSRQPSGDELMKLAFPPDGHPNKPQPAEPYLGCAMNVAERFGIPGYLGQ